MKRFFLLVVICIAAIGGSAQENSVILRGRVFAPDGKLVRNRQGTLNLNLEVGSSVSMLLTVKTDDGGQLYCEQQDALKYLEQERGKRALAWVYLLFPEVGVDMTRRFFWTVGEPLPDLHLKPLARLKVDLFYPTLNISLKHEVQVSRADDPRATWRTEWVPANEWLTVSRINVKLKPGEEKHLLIYQMPQSGIPVRLRVYVPYSERVRLPPERLPPLLMGRSLLRGHYGAWEGLATVDRTEPFSFAFVPPMHLLRIPTEQIEMKPLLDIFPSFNYLEPSPITEIECNLVTDDAKAKSLFYKWHAFRFNQHGWKQWERVIRDLFLYEESEALLPREEHEHLCQWLQRPSYEDLPRKFWVTQWTPMIARVSVREKDRRYTLAFPVKGGEAAKRRHFTVVFSPSEQEQPKVLRLKTGQLKGTVRTLDGKPVVETTVIARFVEDKLIERLTEEGEVDFLTETDEQGNFVFTDLPEGKYDLFVLSINPWWVGCTEAIVKAGQTTMVNLVGYFEQEQKLTRRRITLHLQFPDGTPVAGYQVNAISTFAVSGLTDEQGRISLEVEGEQLEIRQVEIDDVPDILLRIHPEQSEFTVTVPIPLRGMVEGRVLLPDGSTSDKVLVTAWKLSEGRRDYIAPNSIYRLRVLPDGRFFCTLPEGTYIFKAEPMLPNLPLNSIYCAPSLSPPIVVKVGEVTKVTWQLRPATSRYLEFPFWRRIPPIGTLHIKAEYYDGQVYEAKLDLPVPVAIVEPLAKLDYDEEMLWDGRAQLSPGFYRLTSWGWQGEEFKSVVRISESTERLTLTPPSAFPTLTVTGRVLLPNNAPASNAIVALYDPDQKMKRWATICDENGQFSLSVQVPNAEILEQQHLDTLLPNSKNELLLIAWKIGYGHSLIHRLPRPRYYETKTVNVGSLTLSQSERIEGQVVDESGKPVPFASVVMLPIDANLFVPKPNKETLVGELTAFEDFDVGSIPHAQVDINGRFFAEGLRQGQYLLVAGIHIRENGKLKELMAYQIVNVPSNKITVRLERLKGFLNAEPSDLTNALPFAEVEIQTPCWRYRQFYPCLRADEFGRFKAEGIPKFENVPMLVRVMHRNGIIASFNPTEDWRYVVQLRP